MAQMTSLASFSPAAARARRAPPLSSPPSGPPSASVPWACLRRCRRVRMPARSNKQSVSRRWQASAPTQSQEPTRHALTRAARHDRLHVVLVARRLGLRLRHEKHSLGARRPRGSVVAERARRLNVVRVQRHPGIVRLAPAAAHSRQRECKRVARDATSRRGHPTPYSARTAPWRPTRTGACAGCGMDTTRPTARSCARGAMSERPACQTRERVAHAPNVCKFRGGLGQQRNVARDAIIASRYVHAHGLRGRIALRVRPRGPGIRGDSVYYSRATQTCADIWTALGNRRARRGRRRGITAANGSTQVGHRSLRSGCRLRRTSIGARSRCLDGERRQVGERALPLCRHRCVGGGRSHAFRRLAPTRGKAHAGRLRSRSSIRFSGGHGTQESARKAKSEGRAAVPGRD